MTTEDLDAKIEAAKAKISSLSNRHIAIKANLEGLETAKAKMAEIHDKTVHVKVDVDQSGLSRITGLLDKFPSLGPVPGGAAGIGVIAAAVAALLPEIVAVTNGLVAAGAGAGAFAALALPAFMKVKSALSDLNTAQQAYSKAQQLFQLDPTKGNADGLRKAADNLKLVQQQMDKMPASERGAVQGIQKLGSEFSAMSRAFQPQAFRVFNDALKVAGNLLPHLTQFATPFATALDGLLQRLNSFTQSNGFNRWMSTVAGLVGPATTAIGNGIAKVANAAGKLLTSFSGKDIQNAMNIAFGAISGTITVVRVAIEGLKTAWDRLSQSPTLKRIVSDFKTAWTQISQIGKKKPDFSAISAAVKDAVNTAVAWVTSKAGPLLKGALSAAEKYLSANAGNILFPIGQAIVEGLINGMKSKIPDLIKVAFNIESVIVGHKGPIEHDRVILVPAGQAIMDGLMNGMDSRMGALMSQVTSITRTVATTGNAGWVGNAGPLLAAPPGGGGPARGGGGYALAGAGDGHIVIENHIHLDGRELTNAISQRAVQTQRRTGTNGMTKRTR